MHEIFLPHTNESVDLDVLLSVCSELMQEWRGAPLSAATTPMPIYISHDALNTRLIKNPEYAYSFDVACRLVSSQRNTANASNVFFNNSSNSVWFERTDDQIPNGIKRRTNVRASVYCVRFTQRCMDYWHAMSIPQRSAALIRAQALLNADVEINDGNDAKCHILPVLPVEPATPLNQVTQNTSRAADDNANRSRAEIVDALVAEIQSAPFQPTYRRRPTADAPVTGWDARLRAYYWPNPDVNYITSCRQIDTLRNTAETLARALQDQGHWDANEEAQAVELADAIFVWGGVRQARHTVTATNVRAVFLRALKDNPESKALMNSGWTKVAAFATAHLEYVDGGKPHVIWDSRVATALIGRLDRQLSAHTTEGARALFPEIGTVPGRGGSRPRKFTLQWPSGYQRWATQVNGSALVREMRDRLNAQNNLFPRMPLPDGMVGNWTTRGVEMVLFMDGY